MYVLSKIPKASQSFMKFIIFTRKTHSILQRHVKSNEHIFVINVMGKLAKNKGAERCPRLISTFVFHCQDSRLSLSNLSILYVGFVAAQAGLFLNWSETPKIDFYQTKPIQYLRLFTTGRCSC